MTAPSETNKRYTIKPLVWLSDTAGGLMARGLLGWYSVNYMELCGRWSVSTPHISEQYLPSEPTKESGAAAAEAHYREQLLTALEEA